MDIKDKGFSIVELIVVMVIIGIVTVIVGLSISTSNSARAEKDAASVNALISKCRAGCLGKTGDVNLTITLNSSGDIVCTYKDGKIVSTDTFDGKGISVSYTMKKKDSDLVTTTPLSESTTLELSFDRSTGGQKAQPDDSHCTAISFTGGRTYTIELVPSTGSHKLV